MIEIGIARTLAILGEMAKGNTVRLGKYDFGMTSEMGIGPIFSCEGAPTVIYPDSDLSLSTFHRMLECKGVVMLHIES